MHLKNISHHRLNNQLISRSPYKHPKEIVRHMTAMQAQDFYASLWAVGVRSSSKITEAETEQAIRERDIVRTWPMRGTLHFVAADDARWMLKLLTPRVIKSSAARLRELELDEAVFSKCRKLIEKALQGGNGLTRAELYQVWENEGISTGGQRGFHIIWYLAQNAVICWGPRRDKQHTFVLFDEWIPKSKNLKGDEALAELASRYIQSRGPVTEYDFAFWAGLTVTVARKAFHLVEKSFEKERKDGHTWWHSELVKINPGTTSGVHLLPAFDEMLCGYKDRSTILKSDQKKSIILRNGILKPMIVWKGKAIGSWKRTLKKNRVIIEMKPFEKLTKNQEKEVIIKAREYASFLGLQVYFK